MNYNYDKIRLLEIADRAKLDAKPYGDDPRYPGQFMQEWLISQFTDKYIESIINDFEVEGRPRFYWLAPNTVLPNHVDHNTTCSINFILSDEPAPVTVEGCAYTYEVALLNTSVLHSVTNGNKERLLFKISIFNETFEELAKRIKFKRP